MPSSTASKKKSAKRLTRRAAAVAKKSSVGSAKSTAQKIKSVTSVQAAAVPIKASSSAIAVPAGAVKAPFPGHVKPMLATLVDEPVTGDGWILEIKWDGYRAISLCRKNKVDIQSRNDKPFSEKYYPIRDALQSLGWNAVVDGE